MLGIRKRQREAMKCFLEVKSPVKVHEDSWRDGVGGWAGRTERETTFT